MPAQLTLLERFNRSYIPEPMSGCWLWEPALHKTTGYGRIRADNNPRGKHLLAHRASWELHHGPIPDGMLVCHKCDVRSCVNPDHFFLGTQKDNIRDAARKGRLAHKPGRVSNLPLGAKHHMAKLTDIDVIAMRESSELPSVLAKRFGVSLQQVIRIRNRESWRHI